MKEKKQGVLRQDTFKAFGPIIQREFFKRPRRIFNLILLVMKIIFVLKQKFTPQPGKELMSFKRLYIFS